MRVSSLVFALALAIALPCGAALLPHAPEPYSVAYLALSGIGLATGLILMVVLDWVDYALGRTVALDQTQAQTDALRVETERRALANQTTPAPAHARAPDVDPVNPYPDRWATYWRRLAQAGDAYGWTQATLTTENTLTKVMSEPAWNTTIPALVDAGWLSGGKPGRATKWASGRSLKAFEQAEAWKALPHPDTDPPQIELPPYRNNTTARGNSRNTTLPVIEG